SCPTAVVPFSDPPPCGCAGCPAAGGAVHGGDAVCARRARGNHPRQEVAVLLERRRTSERDLALRRRARNEPRRALPYAWSQQVSAPASVQTALWARSIRIPDVLSSRAGTKTPGRRQRCLDGGDGVWLCGPEPLRPPF